MSGEASPYGLPPEEAIAYFRAKGYKTTFDWHEMIGEEHARAFTVAKATQREILEDIRKGVEKAIVEGTTLAEFRTQLEPILTERGWWGKQEVRDKDGKLRLVQLGSARRLRTIYETNLRMAQSAGRWERIQRTKDRRPYLRYVAILDGYAREEHERWHGTVLRVDDEWWNTHYPPNGWGCRCKVQQLSDRDLERYGYEVSKQAPAVSPVTVEVGGATFRVPRGIDPSFAYNVGLARADVVALAGNAAAPWNNRRTYTEQPINERARKFKKNEKPLAEYLARKGHEVAAQKEDHRDDKRKFDALVNGQPTELKKLNSPGALTRQLRKSVKDGGQAPFIVIDARGLGLTGDGVQAHIRSPQVLEDLDNRLAGVKVIISDTEEVTLSKSDLAWP